MPPKSQAQRRWAYATVEGKTDAPKSVGEEFLGHGIKGLPDRVKPMGKGMQKKGKSAKSLRHH